MAVTPVGNPYVESSDLVANYPGVSEALAERIDIVGVNPFADSAARATAIPSPTEGMMSSLNDTDAVQRYDGATWKPLGGKVLQVVRATDSTDRSTASTSYVDATGMTVTITPTSATSSILLFSSFLGATNTNGYFRCQITTSSNVAVSGAEDQSGGFSSSANKDFPFVLIGYASPATTSAVTYKVRFKIESGTVGIMRNANITGQVFAIEVAA